MVKAHPRRWWVAERIKSPLGAATVHFSSSVDKSRGEQPLSHRHGRDGRRECSRVWVGDLHRYMMLLALLLGLLISPSPVLNAYAATIPKSVFAHVVVGILDSYTQSQWAQEISDAKASGIDAFALNIGKDSYTQTQLGYAYAAAEADVNFKMFISFDFGTQTRYSLPEDTDLIVQTINRFGSSSAQYNVDGKPLVTTFIGDNQDWSGVKSRANIFFAPNRAEPNSIASNSLVEGGYPWNAWGTVNNSIPDSCDKHPIGNEKGGMDATSPTWIRRSLRMRKPSSKVKNFYKEPNPCKI